MIVIGGIDQSPTSTGLAWAPLDWCPDFTRVQVRTVPGPLEPGSPDLDRAIRNAQVAAKIVRFGKLAGVRLWAFEGYAYSQAHRAHEIAETCGVIRHELVKAGFEITTVWVSSARKLLLGKNPTRKRDGDPKKLVRDAFRVAGAPHEWKLDETDAVAVMNSAIADRGGRCIAQLRA